MKYTRQPKIFRDGKHSQILHTFYIVEYVVFTFLCYIKVDKSSAKEKNRMKTAYFTDILTPETNGVTSTLNELSHYLKTNGIKHAFFTADYGNRGIKEPDTSAGVKRVQRFSDKMLIPPKHSPERLGRRGYKNLGIWPRGMDKGRFNAGLKSTELRSRLGAGDKFAFLLPRQYR